MRDFTEKQKLVIRSILGTAVLFILILSIIFSGDKKTTGNTTAKETENDIKVVEEQTEQVGETADTTEAAADASSDASAGATDAGKGKEQQGQSAQSQTTKKYPYKDMAEAAEGRREDIRPEIEAQGVSMDLTGSGNEMTMALTLNTYMPPLVAKATLSAAGSQLDEPFQELIDELAEQVDVKDPVLHGIIYNKNGKELWRKDYYPSKK